MTPAQNERLGRASRALAQLVSAKSGGQIAFRLWTGEVVGVPPEDGKPPFEIRISSPAALRQLILKPGIESAAQLYAAGDFDFGDVHPIELLKRVDHTRFSRKLDWREKLAAARSVIPIIRHGGRYADPMAFKGQAGRFAGKDRDDKSLINFHYDLSNRFYELFLGEELAYSCGYYERADASLDEAQQAKHDLICRKLRLAPGLKLFDTGCGWGGLICHAAKNFGVKAHGVTLSKEQHAYATAKIARMGLEDRVTVELRDYRSVDAPDTYDRIAQIEMFEHVGIDNHDDHFRHVHRLLRPRGLYLHQASTRRPTFDLARFRKPTVYQRFTTRYIFPGGELDYIGLSVTNLERNGFEVHDVENLREHYLKTAEAWAENLWRNREEAAREVGEARTRMWLAYLSAITIAFRRLNLNVFQTLASKRRIGASGLPLDRRWMTMPPSKEKANAAAQPRR